MKKGWPGKAVACGNCCAHSPTQANSQNAITLFIA
jgi:hypothetical protein